MQRLKHARIAGLRCHGALGQIGEGQATRTKFKSLEEFPTSLNCVVRGGERGLPQGMDHASPC